MRSIYFVRERRGGSNLIKIGKTDDCPYLRLDQLRNAERQSAHHSRYELLGVLEAAPEEINKQSIQSQFEHLRENGDWFRPGTQLVDYIRENARPHFCSRYCPDGPAVEEQMRSQDAIAGEAIRGR